MWGSIIFVLVFIFAGNTVGEALIASNTFLIYWFGWLTLVVLGLGGVVIGLLSFTKRQFAKTPFSNKFNIAFNSMKFVGILYGIVKYLGAAFLAYWLTINIDPTITSLTMLETKEIVATIATIILLWI